LHLLKTLFYICLRIKTNNPMKLSTFESRTAALSRNSHPYKNAKLLLAKGERVYTCHTSGKGRFTSNLDYTQRTVAALQIAGLELSKDFRAGNDAPREGLTGNYVELTTRGRAKMIKQ
jgi:hypothetical protein